MLKFFWTILLIPFMLLPLSCVSYVNADDSKQKEFISMGWLEQVKIYPSGLIFHAKLDTGADNCSVHAENIKYTKKKGLPWVSFEMANRYGKRSYFERKIIRVAKVKKKEGGFQKRPVVRLGVCLGNIYENIECSLVDRSNFAYPVLIGRNVLAGGVIVNSSETYTTDPECYDVRIVNE